MSLQQLENEYVSCVITFVQQKFGGDARAAFNAYATTEQQMSEDDLLRFMNDANVPGSFLFSRKMVAGIIMKKVDANQDGLLSWDEIQSAISSMRLTVHVSDTKQLVVDRIDLLG